MITVNMNKARDIWRNKLREARTPILSNLDIEFQRALETSADTSEIVQKKQSLRDITKHPDLLSASTTEELKQFWPEILNG